MGGVRMRWGWGGDGVGVGSGGVGVGSRVGHLVDGLLEEIRELDGGISGKAVALYKLGERFGCGKAVRLGDECARRERSSAPGCARRSSAPRCARRVCRDAARVRPRRAVRMQHAMMLYIDND